MQRVNLGYLKLMWSTAAIVAVTAAVLHSAPSESQRTFATPQEAVQAAIDAAEHNDTAALMKLFGPGGKAIVESGDASDDTDARAEFVRAAHEKTLIEQDPKNPQKASLLVGNEDWPFPVPLIREDGKWRFDSSQGRVEILARRIGRNELNAMEICRGYVEAQMEFAAQNRDGDGILKYAQKIVSAQGKQDGLYSDGAPQNLVTKEFAGATAASSPVSAKAEPYHGYYFRVLKSQGPDAAGGAFSYVVKDKMIGGFALVAWPADYGVSGIGTFIVNHQGIVHEKDLGTNTAALVRQITRFNPDKSWRRVELE
jgi:hypothetical protein